VLVVVDGDRAVPDELDAFCLALGDRDPGGGQFGRLYRLEGELAALPQSLAVEAGGASSAIAWVRGYRRGVEVARARAGVDFGGDVTLRLDRCAAGSSAAPESAATAGPLDAHLVPVLGRGGAAAIAIAGGAAVLVDADATELRATDLGAVGVVGAVARDADGDCDDDLALWTDAEAHLWRRDADAYVDTGAFASLGVRAAAAADVDHDGDQDLVLGAGATLRLYGSGADGLTEDAAAIPSGTVTDVTALALGDLDGDGNPDLVVGQGATTAAPPRAFLADPSGAGVFTPAPAILPEVDLQVRDLALADLDGDADLDLAVALDGAAARLYVNRGGLLEDQSFVRLPQPAPTAAAVAAADWNGDCLPDLALAATAGSQLLRGADRGTLVVDADAAAASSAAFVDIDDDGDLDLLLATPDGVAWIRR